MKIAVPPGIFILALPHNMNMPLLRRTYSVSPFLSGRIAPLSYLPPHIAPLSCLSPPPRYDVR